MTDEKVILDFIGHTDFAAAVRPSYHCPGAVKLAAYFDYFRRQNPEGTIVLDAGDVLVGAPIINLTHGEPVIEVVNLFGYEAMTLGNHEFDYGRAIMDQTLALARFPLLCANIVRQDTGNLLEYTRPYILLEKLGVQIGVLGVTTEYTPFMVKEESFAPFAVRSVIDACNHYIPRMKADGADIVVVLGHLPGRIQADGTQTGELFEVARAVPGIDILFGGHNVGDVAVRLGRTLVSKTGFSANSIGHIRIAYDRRSKAIEGLVNEIVPVLHGSLPVEPNRQIEAAVEQALAPFIPVLDEVLGEAEDDLVVSFSDECALGNFFTDCMKSACGAQIGVMNSTSTFGYMPKGPITAEMIMWVMCFNDNLYRGSMTGRQIRDMLELTYEEQHKSLNGSLQLSGLRVVLDTSRPAFQRVRSVTLDDGKPIQDGEAYLVATSAYIASGGNGYRAITAQTDWEKMALMAHTVFIEQMKRIKRLNSRVQGRLVDLAQ